MTWNANKPAANESPSLAPQQIRTNWLRLQNILTQDHNFTTTSASDQGWHKIVHHITQTGDMGDDTPAPVSGTGQTYTKEITTTGVGGSTAGAGEHLVYQRGTGGGQLQEAALSVCPIRAAVSFQGNTGSSSTINWAYNVDSVTRNSIGDYTVNFDVDMPSIYYIPVITGQRTTKTESGDPLTIIGVPQGGTYTDTFKVDAFKVFFSRTSTQEYKDPQTGLIIIYGG